MVKVKTISRVSDSPKQDKSFKNTTFRVVRVLHHPERVFAYLEDAFEGIYDEFKHILLRGLTLTIPLIFAKVLIRIGTVRLMHLALD
mgnify:CR=1 FL=1